MYCWRQHTGGPASPASSSSPSPGSCSASAPALLWGVITTARRTTPIYDPPVLAGRQIPGYCSAGVYARHEDTVVLTSSPHCAGEGITAITPDGTTEGVFGPTARSTTCPHPDHTCAGSDMNYLVVAPDRIPWGHLNEIDLGVGGYRTLGPDTAALGCDDIGIDDPIELNGRDVYRTGQIAEKGAYLHAVEQDGSYFACMLASRVGPGRARRLRQRGARPRIPAGITCAASAETSASRHSPKGWPSSGWTCARPLTAG